METLHLIGNAHLDPVWFWPWQEGYQEIKATFLSALDRMDENEHFIFTCACADYYRWVEENDPILFERIKARIEEGRWVLSGGMWVQPDMNIPSAESFARHFLYSQRYFMEKFGRIAQTGYNVDSFGHNAMTPQFLKKAGMHAYVWMRPGPMENAKIPNHPMRWQSPDGSWVLACRIEGEYFGDYELDKKIDRLWEHARKTNFPAMCFYGIGNHGGGPTIRNLTEIDRYLAQSPNGDKTTYSSPDRFFDAVRACDTPFPIWKEELQHHASGCYSTHSISKRRHRMAENALVRMEKLGTLSHVLTGFEHKKPFVRQAWQNLLFNEFHDAMGGCCAEDVMETVVQQLDETLSIAAREENSALQRISWQVDTSKGQPHPVRNKEGEIFLWNDKDLGTPVVVFNPHEFEAAAPVHLRRPFRYAEDDAGTPVPVQVVRAGRTNAEDKWDAVIYATVPPMGYKLFWAYFDEKETLENPLSVSPRYLENAFIRAEFDASGNLCALIDKASGLNTLSAPAQNVLMDISHCDTWAHMEFTFDKMAGAFAPERVTVTENGPVRASIRVDSRFGKSTLSQTYTLYRDKDQLEIHTRLDMQEKHRMVKMRFPTPFEKDGCDISEIPGGVIARIPTMEEQHCHRFICMQGEQGGLALLNDGKYSYSAKDGVLYLTVSNTSIFADHYGQHHRDEDCRHMDMGMQHFTCILHPYKGAWQQQKLHQRAALLNQSLPFLPETYHKGTLPTSMSTLRIDSPQISVLAFKEAEDSRGNILRLNEMTGQHTNVHVDLSLLGRKLDLAFTPFEIKTLYIPHDSSMPVRECLLTEYSEVTE